MAASSAYFCAANRGKKSITVNLSKPEGQAIVRELASLHGGALTLDAREGGGLVARVADPAVEVVLTGPVSALNTLLPDEVRATVDVAGRGPGTYTLPIRVQAPGGITVAFVQATTAEVTIATP